MEIRFYLNGKETVVNAQPERLLVDVLREDLHLTGTKRGCGEGECGTCTVLLNDKAVHACMTMIAQVNGHRVITSEGVESDPRIAPIIPAFVNNMAIQCGYCTPGMVMSAAGLHGLFGPAQRKGLARGHYFEPDGDAGAQAN